MGGALTIRSGSESVAVGIKLSSCLRSLNLIVSNSSPGFLSAS